MKEIIINKIYKCNVEDKEMRVMVPSNISEILELPFKTKTIGKNKRASRVVKYLLSEMFRKMELSGDFYASINSLKISANAGFATAITASVVTILLDNGYLTIGQDYVATKSSRKYGFGPKLRDVTWSLDAPAVYQKCSINKLPAPVRLEVNTTLYTSISDNIAEKRSWSENSKTLWNFIITQDWNNEKTVGQTNREFGTWSFIPKEVRGVFEINKEPVLEVDIVSSNALMMYGVIYKDLDDTVYEKGKMKQLLETNSFYEYVMDVTNIKSKNDSMTDRDYIKELVNSFICGKRPTKELKDNIDSVRMTNFFKQEFPYLYLKIDTAKAFESVNKEGKKRWVQAYKQLGYELQNLEASIIVDTLCNEFTDAFSLHDAVVCPVSQTTAIQNRLSEIILDKIGISVMPKIENRREELLNYGK